MALITFAIAVEVEPEDLPSKAMLDQMLFEMEDILSRNNLYLDSSEYTYIP